MDKNNKDLIFKDYPCVKLLKDLNGNYFSEEVLKEYSKKVSYIVTVMRKNQPSVALYKYKVAQSSLIDFLNKLKNVNLYEQIVEIEKYIPENLA